MRVKVLDEKVREGRLRRKKVETQKRRSLPCRHISSIPFTRQPPAGKFTKKSAFTDVLRDYLYPPDQEIFHGPRDVPYR